MHLASADGNRVHINLLKAELLASTADNHATMGQRIEKDCSEAKVCELCSSRLNDISVQVDIALLFLTAKVIVCLTPLARPISCGTVEYLEVDLPAGSGGCWLWR